MNAFGTAQGHARVEDARLLTGAGRYVDDIAPAGALRAVFLRSDVAAGRIAALDVSAARAMPGVAAVLTAADLRAAGVTLGMRGVVQTNRDGRRAAAPERPVLATDRVCHVGQPIACILAETRAQALDAAEAVALDLTHDPVHLDLAPGGAPVHPEAPDNIAYDWETGDAAATDAGLAAAAHVIRLSVRHNRVIVNPIEPRTAWADWDGARLHFAFAGQGVWNQKTELARHLGLPPEAVQVLIPDVGGGFGMKAMTYPEYPVIAAASRLLGRPVRWTAERTEGMLTDNAGRDLVAQVTLGLAPDLAITAYRVDLISNLGAFNSQFGQAIQSDLFAKVLTGIYDIPAAHLRARGVYTHTAPVDAYRGAGRPEAIYTLERTLDHAARVLGADPAALRRRNMIRTFPFRTLTGELIDSGDFPRILDRLLAEADLPGLPARRAAAAARGRVLGAGLACYIEAILGDPSETARLVLEAGGGATLYVGTQSSGQGHETVYAGMVAAQTGLPLDAIRVVQGDSDAIPAGGGTGGSRSVTVQGVAIAATVQGLTEAMARALAPDLGPGTAFAEGVFRAPGSNLTLTLAEAADRLRAAGLAHLLDHSRTTRLPGRSYPNGAHWAEVAIDPETGHVEMLRHIVTDDFGVLVHPRLAEGQVQGGVVQGIGQVLMENAVHDSQGQPLAATFMDYALPRAGDVPMIRFTTEPVPSTANPLGMKGCGEAGTVGALPAVANAVQDALARLGAGPMDMPFTPHRIWDHLRRARAVAD